ncbi:MAG: hypothetical protein V7L12_05570, partial [Nostoc sp.]
CLSGLSETLPLIFYLSRCTEFFQKSNTNPIDTIFLAISLEAVNKFQVSLATSHLDSSSMHVHGEYNVKLPEVIFENGESENSPTKKRISTSDKYYPRILS